VDPIKTEIADSIEDQLNKEKRITQYIKDSINTTHYTSTQSEGYSFIRFDINAEVNSQFTNLSDEEKYEVLVSVANILEENTDIEYGFRCGEKKICAYAYHRIYRWGRCVFDRIASYGLRTSHES
jgi:hypothetical protein